MNQNYSNILCLVIAVGTSVLSARGAEVPTGLTLSNRIARNDISIAEPLCISSQLINNSSEAIEINVPWNRLQFLVSYAGGPFVVWNGSQRGKDKWGTIQIPPKKMVVSNEILFARNKSGNDGVEFILNQAGDYKLKTRIQINSTVIESEILNLKVTALSSEEGEAKQLVEKTVAARMVQGLDISIVGAQQLQNIVDQFPKSIFADWAHVALATYHLSPFRAKEENELVALTLAYKDLQAVSDRQDELKVRAVILQGKILSQRPEMAGNIAEFLQLLTKYEAVAAEVGLGKDIEELRKHPNLQRK